MFEATVRLAAPSAGIEHVLRDILVTMVNAVIMANRQHLEATPGVPMLYASGVRYQREPAGSEVFRDIVAVLETRTGDCEDLVAWRVAELQVRGEWQAQPYITAQRTQTGGRMWHVRVRRADGRIEDPSERLGMR